MIDLLKVVSKRKTKKNLMRYVCFVLCSHVGKKTLFPVHIVIGHNLRINYERNHSSTNLLNYENEICDFFIKWTMFNRNLPT